MKRFSIAIIALVLIGYLMISVDSADPDESEFHYYYICGNFPLVYKYKDHLIYRPEENPDSWNLIKEDDFGRVYQTVNRYGNTEVMYIEKISNRISFNHIQCSLGHCRDIDSFADFWDLTDCEVEKTLSKK
tara:strand:+ start:47 stop:439 length:393 start_codon:yes stop_codon:yes gene_type:complete